ALRRLLQHIGAEVEAGTHTPTISAKQIGSADAPYDLVKTMRASVLVLGPLLARTGSVRVSLPGGCAIGVRPINLHLAAFEKLGAEVRLEHGYVEAKAERVRGAEIVFDTVAVAGNEKGMAAASLAQGPARRGDRARGRGSRDAADGDGGADPRRRFRDDRDRGRRAAPRREPRGDP